MTFRHEPPELQRDPGDVPVRLEGRARQDLGGVFEERLKEVVGMVVCARLRAASGQKLPNFVVSRGETWSTMRSLSLGRRGRNERTYGATFPEVHRNDEPRFRKLIHHSGLAHARGLDDRYVVVVRFERWGVEVHGYVLPQCLWCTSNVFAFPRFLGDWRVRSARARRKRCVRWNLFLARGTA